MPRWIPLFAFILISTFPLSVNALESYWINGLSNPQPPKASVDKASTVRIRLGGQVRFAPTLDMDWDFGVAEKAEKFATQTSPGETQPALTRILIQHPELDPRIHLTEAGYASEEYWRTEARLTFDFEPEDKKWHLFMAFECDTLMSSNHTDQGCTRSGIERLHAQMQLPSLNSTLHAGWDFYTTDAILSSHPTPSISGPMSLYADDDPGIWLTGQKQNLTWQLGWHKKFDLNTQVDSPHSTRTASTVSGDHDRNIYDGNLQYQVHKDHQIKFLWARDQIRTNNPFSSSNNLQFPQSSKAMNVLSEYLGVLYYGQFMKNIFRITGQYLLQSGSAQNTGVAPVGAFKDDYKVAASLLYLNLMSVWHSQDQKRGRVSLTYLQTSGDSKDDNELNGYTGIVGAQKFSQHIGSNHSIFSEHTPLTLGTQLYGMIPEFHGSRGSFGEQGAAIGGLAVGSPEHRLHTPGGRGDNPGLTLWNINVGNRFHPNWVYQTQYRIINYNEAFFPYLTEGADGKPIKAGHIGNEWTHEIFYVLNWNAMIQFAYAQLEPGPVLKRITKVLAYHSSPKIARHLSIEFIWRF